MPASPAEPGRRHLNNLAAYTMMGYEGRSLVIVPGKGVTMEYGNLIQRAGRIALQHKSLWPFGIALALFGGGAAGLGNGGGTGYRFGSEDLGRLGWQLPSNWDQIAAAVLAVIAVIGVLAVVLTIIGVVVRYTCIGALVGMAAEAESAGDVTFRSGLSRGWKHVLRLFLIALVIGVATAALAFVFMVIVIAGAALVALPALAMFRAGDSWAIAGGVWAAISGFALLAIMILAAIALSGVLTLVKEYAYRSAVLAENGVFDSIGNGIALLRGHLTESVWIWIVLGLLNLALGLVLTPVVLAIGAGAFLPAMALWKATETAALPLLAAAPAVLIGGAILTAIQGVFLAFQSVVWTLVYREIEPPAAA
jgi:hypothetical protein